MVRGRHAGGVRIPIKQVEGQGILAAQIDVREFGAQIILQQLRLRVIRQQALI